MRSISFETEISRQDIVQKIAQGTYLGRGAAAGEGKQAWTIEEGARARRTGRHRCSALSCIPYFFQLPDIIYLPIVVTVCSTKVMPTFFSLVCPLSIFVSKRSSMSGYHPPSLKKRWMISRHASWAAPRCVRATPDTSLTGNRAVRETIGSRQYMYCTVLLYCLQYQTCAHIMLRRGPR